MAAPRSRRLEVPPWRPRRTRVLPGQLELPWPAESEVRPRARLRLLPQLLVRRFELETCELEGPVGDRSRCTLWRCRHSLLLDQLSTRSKELGPWDGSKARWFADDRAWSPELREEWIAAVIDAGIPTCSVEVASGGSQSLLVIGRIFDRSDENARKWEAAAIEHAHELVERDAE